MSDGPPGQRRTLGQRIRQERQRRGWTLVQAAEHLGVSKNTVSNWENDAVFPGDYLHATIRDVLGIDLIDAPRPAARPKQRKHPAARAAAEAVDPETLDDATLWLLIDDLAAEVRRRYRAARESAPSSGGPGPSGDEQPLPAEGRRIPEQRSNG